MDDTQSKRERIRSLKNKLDAPRMVGEGDIVPFAWRQPLTDPGKRMNKVYKSICNADRGRSSLPVVSDDK